MINMFISYDLYHRDPVSGKLTKSGYGSSLIETEELNISEIFRDAMKSIMKRTGVQENEIHVLTFKRV